MSRGRAVALLLLGVLAAGCGGPAAPAPPAASRAPAAGRTTSARCADVVVLGFRGQGQSLRGAQGVGRQVLAVVRATVPRLTGETARLEAVPFPSGSNATYDADVATGVRRARRQVASLARDCPDSRVALVGYSQGAEVVHRVATTGVYAAVVLLGDPLRDPRAPVRTVGFGTTLTGRGNAGPGPAFADGAAVVEVCAAGDNVCDAPPAGRVGPVSRTHHDAYAEAAHAARVGQVLAATLRRR